MHTDQPSVLLHVLHCLFAACALSPQAVQPRITSEWAKYCYYVHKVS